MWIPQLGAAIPIAALALAIRLHMLGEPAVSWDEGWSAWLARQSWPEIAVRTAADEHPPLYYWFLQLWTLLAGNGAFAQRFSSVAFGVIAVSLSYAVASRVGGRLVGYMAASFMALAPFHVRWSQEIRAYALGVLLVVLLLWCAVRWTARPGRFVLGAYVITGLAALHTHYLLLTVVALLGVVMSLQLFFQRRTAVAIAWLGAHLVLGVAFTPWLLYYLSHATVFTASPPLEWGHLLMLSTTVLPLGISDSVERFVPVSLPFLALTLAGAVMLLTRKDTVSRGQAISFLALTVLPLLLVQLASRIPQAPFHPKMAARYVAFALPFYGLLLAQGAAAVWRKHVLLGLVLAAVGSTTLGWSLDRYFDRRGQNQKEEVEAIGRFIELNHRDGDTVLLLGDRSWPVVRFYAGNTDPWLYVSDTWRSPSYEQLSGIWTSLPSTPLRVWLIKNERSHVIDPDGQVEAWLLRRVPRIWTFTFGSRSLSLYGQTPPSASEAVTFAPRDSSGFSFAGERVPARWLPGRTRYVFTVWPRDNSIVHVRLVLRSPLGRVVWLESRRHFLRWQASADEGARVIHTLALPATLPGGSYALGVRVSGVNGEVELPIGQLAVQGVLSPSRPSNLQPAHVVFGGQIALTGVQLEHNPTTRAEQLDVLLSWQAKTPVSQEYKLFLHLVDSDGRIWAQLDQFPTQHDYSMASMVSGDEVLGRYALRLPTTPLPETLLLLGGLYDPVGGQRVPITDSSEQVLSDHRAVLAELPLPLVREAPGSVPPRVTFPPDWLRPWR